MTRLVPGALVVTVATGLAVLSGVVANAIPPAGTLGSLTLTPSTGSDLTAPVARTSGACPIAADSANMLITGPVGAADPTFPPDNPYPIVTTTKASFSTTDPFNLPFRINLKDAAADRGKTLQAGEYDLTARCVKGLTQEVFGTFTGALVFTSPTSYQASTPTTTPATTSATTTAATTTPVTTTPATTTPATTTPVTTTPATTTPATTTPATTTSTTTVPTTSTTSDSVTTPATTTSGIANTNSASGSGNGTSGAASTGILAKTGGPIGLIFLASLVLLAAGLALVLVMQNQRKRISGNGTTTTDRPQAPTART